MALDIDALEVAAGIPLDQSLRERVRQAVEDYLLEAKLEERQPAVSEVRERLQHTATAIREGLKALDAIQNNEDPALVAALSEATSRADVAANEVVATADILRRLAEGAEAAEQDVVSLGGRPKQQARQRLIENLKSVLASAGAPTEVTYDPYSEENRGPIIDLSLTILTQIGDSTGGLVPACKRAKAPRG